MWWTLTMALAGDCATEAEQQLTVPTPFAFASRSSELTDDTPVRAVLCALDADAARTVQIEVHTDSMGSGAYNLRMSQDRADAIRNGLLALGVEDKRVTAVGYGELYPIDTNSSATGRAANRRIELHLTPPSERPPAPKLEPVPDPDPDPDPAPASQPKPTTMCEQLARTSTALQSNTWTLPGSPADRIAEVVACLPDAWDVDRQQTALYAHQPGWQLTVQSVGDEVQVRLSRD